MTQVNWEPIEKIANAVLYEGFLLYPYRKSAVKNQQRWHFGTLGPEGGSEPVAMQTQCLVEGGAVDIKIRFLQGEIEREVEFEGRPGRHEFTYSALSLAVEVAREPLTETISRLTVRIANTGKEPMLSVHTLLRARDGGFVSLPRSPG